MYSAVIFMLTIIYLFEYFLYIDGCGSLFIYEMIYYTLLLLIFTGLFETFSLCIYPHML